MILPLLQCSSLCMISSEDQKVLLNDKRVIILIPSIGDLSVQLFAAGMRSQGFNAIALPEGNNDILKYGRANATGKECLPLILCAGSLIDYLENQWDGKSYVVFLLVQGADRKSTRLNSSHLG